MNRLLFLLPCLTIVFLLACSSSHEGAVGDGGAEADAGLICGAISCGPYEVCCAGCTDGESFCQTPDLPCPAVACPPAPVVVRDCREAEGAATGAPCEGGFSCSSGDECCFTSTYCEGGVLTRDELCLDDCLPPASECAGLGPARCLASGCVPTYDDSCCPTCTEGGCGDCVDPDFYECRPAEDCMAAYCSLPTEWDCAGDTPDCSDATQVDEDSCSIRGCVPAVGPVGSPELPAICVPITANSCTTACRRVAPECPAGMAPEGDGFCYTDRCIPAIVCS